MTRQSFLQTLATLMFLSACSSPGDRAAQGGEGCPPEEKCSAKTPNGLWFAGTSFFDASGDFGPKTTAVFGTQTIEVLASSSLFDTFSEDFTTESSAPLLVSSTSPPNVVVSADGEGSGYLRIIDPSTQELFDRISITSATPQSVRIVPTDAIKYDPDAIEGVNWSFLTGTSVELGIMLLDLGNNRLVDEGLTVNITGDATDGGNSSSWDKHTLSALGVGFAEINVHSMDGNSLPAGMPVVDTIDDVALVASTLEGSTSLSIVTGKERVYCFRGLSGNRAVAGLSWTISTSGSITAKPEEGPCFRVKAGATGTGSFTGTTTGFKKSFSVTVTANAASGPSSAIVKPALQPSTGPARGERVR